MTNLAMLVHMGERFDFLVYHVVERGETSIRQTEQSVRSLLLPIG